MFKRKNNTNDVYLQTICQTTKNNAMKRKMYKFYKETEVVFLSMLIALAISSPISYIGYMMARMI
jgi:hypothetical protein